MKRILLCALCVLCGQIATFADDPGSASGASAPDSPLVTTLLSDGSTNSWTQADLIAALQLMNRKYHRDCKTESGRQAWHGKLVMQEINTNECYKISTYADGKKFIDPFRPPQPVQPKGAELTRSGLPKKLVEAQMRRKQEKATTNTVTIVVKPDEIAEE